MVVRSNPTTILITALVFLAVGIIIIASGALGGVGPTFIAIIFIVIALAMIVFCDITTFTIDKGTGIFVINKKSIFGIKERRLNLADLDHFDFITTTKVETGGAGANTSKYFDDYLVLKNGDKILIAKETPLMQYSSFGSFFSHSKDIPILRDIASFAGIPFVDHKEQETPDVIEAIQNFQATETPEEMAIIQPKTPPHQILNHPAEPTEDAEKVSPTK
jgi:hypothetical protein